jgi:predicted lipoprotein
MMRKIVKYAIAAALLIFILTQSVYFEKLDAHQASAKAFDAVSYASNYWNNKLMPNLGKALETEALITMLRTDKENAFNRYSHALGIGNIRFFLIKGEGRIMKVNENDVVIRIGSDSSNYNIRIATEYVFGNAVRDASGVIDINEFNNTMDFNNVSAEINKIIRAKVLPTFKAAAKAGDQVQFTGAIELNREHVNLDNIELIPVSLKLIP